MNKEPPYSWIQTVDQAVAKLDQKPQFGLDVPFPYAKLEKHLAKLFDQKELTVVHNEKGWIQKGSCFEGLGEELFLHSVFFAPLDKELYFVTSTQDLTAFLTALLQADAATSSLLEPSLVEGFGRYLSLAVLQAVDSLGYAPSLSPRLGALLPKEGVKDEPMFRIDVALKLGETPFWGRLLIPESFRKAFNGHDSVAPATLKTFAQSSQGEKLLFDIALECGSVDLPLSQWKEAKENDFILLDKCSYDPGTKKGRVILTLNSHPLFRGRVTKEGLKLYEYPLYEEVGDTMDDRVDEDDFYDDLEEDEDEEEFDEEFDDEEEFDEEDVEEIEKEIEPPVAPVKMKKEMAKEDKGVVSADDIPIHLTVEVGHIKMSAKELLELSPGNLLDLNAAPEQGVHLMVGGKRVGKGELVRMGDVLGVRILKL